MFCLELTLLTKTTCASRTGDIVLGRCFLAIALHGWLLLESLVITLV